MKLTDKIRFYWRAFRYRYILDPGEITSILNHISSGDHVVDIGAHKGAYTYWIQNVVGPSGHLTCFEPQPALSAYLKNAVSGFNWKHVTVVAEGVSSEPGEMSLYVPAGKTTSPGASLEKDKDHSDATQIPVEVTTLDSYFGSDRDKSITLIKCDVEGHELEVFKGAESILLEDKPALLFECEGRHRAGSVQEVFTYLEKLGYTGFFIDGKQVRPLMEFNESQHQIVGNKLYLNNFLFLSSSN